MSLTNYDFAFGGGVVQDGGRRYKSGPGGDKGIPKFSRLKLRVVDGNFKYVPKKLRKRSGRNVFLSDFADKTKISGPELFVKGNKAWKKLSTAEKEKWERKADAMGYKPAAKPRPVAKRYRKSPAKAKSGSPKRKSSGKRKSPKRRSSGKNKRKSPKRKSKSPKRKSSGKKKRSKSPKRKLKGGSFGEDHSAYEVEHNTYDETYEAAPDILDNEFMF